MRKGLLYAAILTGCLGRFEFVDAAYVIKLKNGNEYLTTRYWHEGTQVRFDTYGGIFGIDKTFVARIEQTNRVVPSPISMSSMGKPLANEQESSSSLAGKEMSNQQTDEKDHKATKAPATQKDPVKKDESVLKEYAELQTRFGQLNDLPKHEIHALDADIGSFRQKLGNSKLAEAHQDELDAMRTLQRAIESYLKASP
ncbi:MAG: hypothetical protein ACREQ2_00310 [Candidatus Binatia bacterium]